MSQLVITVIAILLSAAATMVSVNYLPFWSESQSESQAQAKLAMAKLESAYNLTVQANNGTAPAPTNASDGGLMANFGGYLKFPPAAPPGYSWSYGQQAADGSAYSGMDYFCLAPQSGAKGLNLGQYRGILNASKIYSSAQAVVSTAGCGAETAALPSSFPANFYLTFYVTYTPGVY